MQSRIERSFVSRSARRFIAASKQLLNVVHCASGCFGTLAMFITVTSKIRPTRTATMTTTMVSNRRMIALPQAAYQARHGQEAQTQAPPCGRGRVSAVPRHGETGRGV